MQQTSPRAPCRTLLSGEFNLLMGTLKPHSNGPL